MLWNTLLSWVRPSAAQAYLGQKTTPNGNRLPSTIHKTLSRGQLDARGRLILVGDIHGCDNEFGRLLEKVGYDEKDNLVLVGDLVNKGPASAQVVQRARRGRAHVVRGNHDDAGLEAYEGWVKGKEPKTKYQWVKQLTAEDANWLREMPFTLSIPSYRVLVVHAGVIPGVPLEKQTMADMYKMRDLKTPSKKDLRAVGDPSLYPDWVALEKQSKKSKAWATIWTGPEHVFFGHDAKRKLQREAHATGLDTGCCYGGELTACVLPSLDELESAGSPPKSSEAPTLQDLRGEIVSVKAQDMYSQPGEG